MATTQLTKMISIWKGQCKKTKLRVLETVVFPTALYGCEAWTINNTDAKRITSFEMKCYRKILRISWIEKVTNKEVLSRLDMKTTMLLQKAKTLYSNILVTSNAMKHLVERHVLEARIEGRRGRGRPTRRWEQDINDWMDMSYDNNSGRKTGRRSYSFPSKGSRSNVSLRDKLIKKKKKKIIMKSPVKISAKSHYETLPVPVFEEK